MKNDYSIGQADFMGRSRVALRERGTRGETVGYVGRTSEGAWLAWPLGGDALPEARPTRAAAARYLIDECTVECLRVGDDIEKLTPHGWVPAGTVEAVGARGDVTFVWPVGARAWFSARDARDLLRKAGAR